MAWTINEDVLPSAETLEVQVGRTHLVRFRDAGQFRWTARCTCTGFGDPSRLTRDLRCPRVHAELHLGLGVTCGRKRTRGCCAGWISGRSEISL